MLLGKIVRTLINKQKTLFITSVRLFANQCFIIVANQVGNGKGKACKKGNYRKRTNKAMH